MSPGQEDGGGRGTGARSPLVQIVTGLAWSLPGLRADTCVCQCFPESKACSVFLAARNEQEEQEEKREIKRRLTRKVSAFSVGVGVGGRGAWGALHSRVSVGLGGLAAAWPGGSSVARPPPSHPPCLGVRPSLSLDSTGPLPGDSGQLSFMTFRAFGW